MSGLSARVHTRHTRVRFLAMPPREGKKAIRNQKQNQNLKKINNRHQNQMGILHCGMANLLKTFSKLNSDHLYSIKAAYSKSIISKGTPLV